MNEGPIKVRLFSGSCNPHIHEIALFLWMELGVGYPPGAERTTSAPGDVIMKWTGHKGYKAMKPYIDIAEKVKAEQMTIFEKGLKE